MRKSADSAGLSGERARVAQRREVDQGATSSRPRVLRWTPSFPPPTFEDFDRLGAAALYRGVEDGSESVADGLKELTVGVALSGLHGDSPELKAGAGMAAESPAGTGGSPVSALADQLAQSSIGASASGAVGNRVATDAVGRGAAEGSVEGDGKGGARKDVAAEEWRRYTPRVVDATKCMARMFCKGRGGQCPNRPRPGKRYRGRHDGKEATPGVAEGMKRR